MGEVYARRLVAAGFSVLGFDVDSNRTERLAEIGGRAASLAEIAQQCDPIVLAVFNTEQVEDVVERALLPAASGKIVLCTSTCDPDRIAALGAKVAARLRFLETPVSGTSEQVRQGDGVGLIGGDPAIAGDVAGVLDALFPRRFHIGKIGDGRRAKLAINLILGLNRLALAEGLVFAARLGLDPAAFLNVARASAASSQVMDTKGPKILSGDFAPEGRVRQTFKDTQLMLDQARKAGQKLPLLEIHADVLAACMHHGDSDADNSIVIDEIRRRVLGRQAPATASKVAVPIFASPLRRGGSRRSRLRSSNSYRRRSDRRTGPDLGEIVARTLEYREVRAFLQSIERRRQTGRRRYAIARVLPDRYPRPRQRLLVGIHILPMRYAVFAAPQAVLREKIALRSGCIHDLRFDAVAAVNPRPVSYRLVDLVEKGYCVGERHDIGLEIERAKNGATVFSRFQKAIGLYLRRLAGVESISADKKPGFAGGVEPGGKELIQFGVAARGAQNDACAFRAVRRCGGELLEIDRVL